MSTRTKVSLGFVAVFMSAFFAAAGGQPPPAKPKQVKSGIETGGNIPGPVHAVVVIHAERPETAGKRSDFIEEYGANPVALVFARSLSDPLARLIKHLEKEITARKNQGVRGLVERTGSRAIAHSFARR